MLLRQVSTLQAAAICYHEGVRSMQDSERVPVVSNNFEPEHSSEVPDPRASVASTAQVSATGLRTTTEAAVGEEGDAATKNLADHPFSEADHLEDATSRPALRPVIRAEIARRITFVSHQFDVAVIFNLAISNPTETDLEDLELRRLAEPEVLGARAWTIDRVRAGEDQRIVDRRVSISGGCSLPRAPNSWIRAHFAPPTPSPTLRRRRA